MVLMVYRVQFISHLRGRSILNLAGTQPSMLFRYCLPAPNQLKHKTLSIPKEATLEKVIPKTKHKWFQSTPPRRRRHDKLGKQFDRRIKISIHASAKEATNTGRTPPPGPKDFNPRLREGGDVVSTILLAPCSFQSTPPRRRRLSTVVTASYCITISIHASAKEATNLFLLQIIIWRISIHASAKEATNKHNKIICMF